MAALRGKHVNRCACGGDKWRYAPACRACSSKARRRTQEERFWERVTKTDGCWLWTGPVTNRRWPYGVFGSGGRGGRHLRAHVFSYRLHKGEVPNGLFVCHSCNNPRCVRPDHLVLGTPKQNSEYMVESGRSPRGERQGRHKLTAEQVLEIRALLATGKETQERIGARFGVSQANVYVIRAGKSWRHLGQG
jgi:hypothetical protein